MLPRKIFLESTNKCNASCSFCPHTVMKRKQGTMSWSTFTKSINEFKDHKNPIFTLHHIGEPLLDPLLIRKIKYIRKTISAAVIGFNTNVSLLTGKIVTDISISGLNNITFSVNGLSQKDYDLYNMNISYQQVKSNIDNFLLINAGRVNTTLQFVVKEKDDPRINEFIRLWGSKVDKIYIKHMHNFLDMDNVPPSKNVDLCNFVGKQIVVFYNGQVGICCWDYDNFYQLGKIDQGIINITESDKYIDFINRNNISPCNVCDYRSRGF